jgi:1-acyl-sn-glycerol-3-phosphate acyltransferase
MIWLALRLWFRLYMGVRVSGLEHVPREGALLVCGNHRSGWDPPLVGALLPRRAWYMAKEELFRYRLLAPVLRWVGAYPVRRQALDRGAIRRSLEVLARGGAIVLFPEGTRHVGRPDRPGPAKPGAALLALRSGAQVVPVGIRGGYGFRSGLEVRFGPPVRLTAPSHRLRGSELAELVEREIMTAVVELMSDRPQGEAVEA